MKKILVSLVLGLLGLFAFAETTFALDPIMVDRGLPITNLNNVSGASRSNVAWSNGNDYVGGDDFTIGNPGEKWVVTAIRTWSIGKLTTFSQEFNDVKLYTGLSSIAPITSVVSPTATTYVGSLLYQSTGGDFRNMWQLDFSDLNWVIDGGTKYYFAVDGIPTNTNGGYGYWFNHASNAALSGSIQDGSDGKWIAWAKNDLSTPNLCDSGATPSGVCNGGWDKSSDINVQVFAHKVEVNPITCPVGTTQAHLETVTVNSALTAAISSTNNLESGKDYLLVSSGDWTNRGDTNQKADAEYATLNNWSTFMDGYNISPYLLGEGEFDLKVGGSFIDWGSYNPAHTYSYLYTGTGSQVNFLVFDGYSNTNTMVPSWYNDNSGNLTVDIYSCNAPVINDPKTKEDCKYGGWENYGFKNQGQCVRFIETGKDSR